MKIEREKELEQAMIKKKNKSAAKSKSTATKVNVAENAAIPVAPVAPAMSAMKLIIQSPSGQEITPEDVRAKINSAVGTVDKVYIRADEGKAYWVHGEEHGAVELW